MHDYPWDRRAVITLILCIAIPLLVGALSSFLTRNAFSLYGTLVKSSIAPPDWLFPVVWTILYILMGVASFLILTSTHESRLIGLIVYFVQLLFNFIWSLLFFRQQSYWFAAIWLALMLIMIVVLIVNTSKYSKAAMYMLLPYALWCCFALYLNLDIAINN